MKTELPTRNFPKPHFQKWFRFLEERFLFDSAHIACRCTSCLKDRERLTENKNISFLFFTKPPAIVTHQVAGLKTKTKFYSKDPGTGFNASRARWQHYLQHLTLHNPYSFKMRDSQCLPEYFIPPPRYPLLLHVACPLWKDKKCMIWKDLFVRRK